PSFRYLILPCPFLTSPRQRGDYLYPHNTLPPRLPLAIKLLDSRSYFYTFRYLHKHSRVCQVLKYSVRNSSGVVLLFVFLVVHCSVRVPVTKVSRGIRLHSLGLVPRASFGVGSFSRALACPCPPCGIPWCRVLYRQ